MSDSKKLTKEQILATVSPATYAVYCSQGKWKMAKHLALINRKLVDVAAGRTKRLLVSMPPRHGKCQKKGTLVLRFDGSTEKIENFKVGDTLLAISEDWKFVEDKVKAIQYTGCKKLYKVTLDNLSSIEASENHKVLTFCGWKTIAELTIDDCLLCPNKLPEVCIKDIPDNHLILAAIWLAEGSKASASYQFTNESKEILAEIERICVEYNWKFTVNMETLCHTVSMEGKREGATPANFLRQYKLRGMKCETIRVPEEIFQCSNDKISLFLGYLWATDGCVNCKTNNNLEYVSNSVEFIKDIQRLLWKFNIRSMYRKKTIKLKGKVFYSWQLVVEDKESIIKFCNNIKICNKQHKLDYILQEVKKRGKSNSKRYTFPKEWLLRLSHKYHWYRYNHDIIIKKGTTHRDKVRKVAEIENDIDLIKQCDGDGDWVRIVSIEEIGDHDTYDIETEQYHNFISNNIVTHNSELISKYLPSWFLGVYPNKRVILASYESNFAASWGSAARDMFEEHNEELFGLKLKTGVQAASKWGVENHDGFMYAVGACGSVTGRGGELILIDDIHKNDEEANSVLMQEKIFNWFGATAYTRLQPGGAIIIIGTRWSQGDLIGRLLEQQDKGGEKWDYLCLPAIAEEDEAEFPISTGRKKGSPLWEEMWPLEALYRIKNSGAMSSYYWAALYQQRPVPAEGGHFQKDWLKYYTVSGDYLVVYPRSIDNQTACKYFSINDCWFFATVDTANKVKNTADYTAIAIWAVTKENDLVLWDLIRDRLTYDQILKELMKLPQKHQKLSYVGIENTGLGIQVITEARNRGLPVRALEPQGKGKDKRANAPFGAVVRMESGKVLFPKNAPYLKDFELELLYFPKGRHDECVDVLAYAANELTRADTYESGDFTPYSVEGLKSIGIVKGGNSGYFSWGV